MWDIDVSWESCEKHKKLPAIHRVAALTVDRWRNVVLMKCHVEVSAQHSVTEFRQKAWCNALNHIKTMGAKKRTSQTPVCEKTYILHPSCSSFLGAKSRTFCEKSWGAKKRLHTSTHCGHKCGSWFGCGQSGGVDENKVFDPIGPLYSRTNWTGDFRQLEHWSTVYRWWDWKDIGI